MLDWIKIVFNISDKKNKAGIVGVNKCHGPENPNDILWPSWLFHSDTSV
jgi:hypothetical protein